MFVKELFHAHVGYVVIAGNVKIFAPHIGKKLARDWPEPRMSVMAVKNGLNVL
jgi:hypothetical protein